MRDEIVFDELVDRLCGKYRIGPHLPNGEPEFGWRQFEAPPIQHEAATEIARLTAALSTARNDALDEAAGSTIMSDYNCDDEKRAWDYARFKILALKTTPPPQHKED